jgi:hypothetical protein
MKFTELAARLNGISTPIGGFSWVPPVVDAQVARRVITFIEVRRVLYSSITSEVPGDCVTSVIEIRNFLTEVLSQGGIADSLEQPIRLMRRCCVKFLEQVGSTESGQPTAASGQSSFGEYGWPMVNYWFGEALGELRSVIALQAGIIALNYKLDVEDDFAAMIPGMDPSSE